MYGVVVADHRVRELVHERVGIEAELLHAEVKDAAEEPGARLARVLCEKALEAPGDAVGLRHAREPDAGLVAIEAGFLEGELAEKEERLAGRRGDPVRVASPRVEHHRRALVGRLLGGLDEQVLQLERAQLLEFLY